jgi:hypothetical protein
LSIASFQKIRVSGVTLKRSRVISGLRLKIEEQKRCDQGDDLTQEKEHSAGQVAFGIGSSETAFLVFHAHDAGSPVCERYFKKRPEVLRRPRDTHTATSILYRTFSIHTSGSALV